MIKKILTGMGHEIRGEAADGVQACELYQPCLGLYQQLKPDMVTLDLVMPNKGGLDTLKDIRRNDPNAKVVVISAIDSTSNVTTSGFNSAIFLSASLPFRAVPTTSNRS
jgi:two-component system chemotaxis response regulator CheY